MKTSLCIIPAWQMSGWINLRVTPKKELESIISRPALGSSPPFKNALLPLLDKADIYANQPGLLLSRGSEGSTAVIARWANVHELFQARQITFNPVHNISCHSQSKLGQRKVILGEEPRGQGSFITLTKQSAN